MEVEVTVGLILNLPETYVVENAEFNESFGFLYSLWKSQVRYTRKKIQAV